MAKFLEAGTIFLEDSVSGSRYVGELVNSLCLFCNSGNWVINASIKVSAFSAPPIKIEPEPFCSLDILVGIEFNSLQELHALGIFKFSRFSNIFMIVFIDTGSPSSKFHFFMVFKALTIPGKSLFVKSSAENLIKLVDPFQCLILSTIIYIVSLISVYFISVETSGLPPPL